MTAIGIGVGMVFGGQLGITPAFSGSEEASDNFDDNSIDPMWTVTGANIVETNQQIELSGTDIGQWNNMRITATSRSEYWAEREFTLSQATSITGTTEIGAISFNSSTGVEIARVDVELGGAQPEFDVTYRDDGGQVANQQASPPVECVVGVNYTVVLHWKESSGPGANDGIVEAWANNLLVFQKTDVDSDTVVDIVRIYLGYQTPTLGTLAIEADNFKAGTTGSGPV